MNIHLTILTLQPLPEHTFELHMEGGGKGGREEMSKDRRDTIVDKAGYSDISCRVDQSLPVPMTTGIYPTRKSVKGKS